MYYFCHSSDFPWMSLSVCYLNIPVSISNCVLSVRVEIDVIVDILVILRPMCVFERERVFMCVWEREKYRESVCERERHREKVGERKSVSVHWWLHWGLYMTLTPTLNTTDSPPQFFTCYYFSSVHHVLSPHYQIHLLSPSNWPSCPSNLHFLWVLTSFFISSSNILVYLYSRIIKISCYLGVYASVVQEYG